MDVGSLVIVSEPGMRKPKIARVTFARIGDDGLRYLSWQMISDGSRSPGCEPRGESLVANLSLATFTNMRLMGVCQ